MGTLGMSAFIMLGILVIAMVLIPLTLVVVLMDVWGATPKNHPAILHPSPPAPPAE